MQEFEKLKSEKLNLEKNIIKKVEYYLKYAKEEEKRKILKALENNDLNIIGKWFSDELEFGTGGLRGIMDIGLSSINEVTISKASYATINYFKNKIENKDKAICVSYDTRNNSDIYSKIVSLVAAKSGLHVYYAKIPLPTPFLSYIIRETKSICGIMITASHNPKNYNGFKVYDETGCQILGQICDSIIEEYRLDFDMPHIELSEFDNLLNEGKIEYIDESKIKSFIEEISKIKFNDNAKKTIDLLNIVYTSLHGTGINIFRHLENSLRFKSIYVESQIIMDGNFPNVKSLNPENKECFSDALILAKNNEADIVIATDPDADRVGFAFKDIDGYYIPSGNEIAVMLFYYICLQTRFNEMELVDKKRINKNYYAVTTIVTTDLFEIIGRFFGIEVIKKLTGFKYIGQQMNLSNDKTFLFAAEESNGYLVSDRIRDKDAFSTIVVACEFASYLKGQRIYARQFLEKIFMQFGYYFNELINIDLSNSDGKTITQNILNKLKEEPFEVICNKKVRKFIDYTEGYNNFPKSDLIQYIGENFKVTIRPSGTEPKLKLYLQTISRDKTSGKELLETFKNFFINLIKTDY